MHACNLQFSLRKPYRFRGVGLHSGRMTEVVLWPAADDSGLQFVLGEKQKSPPFQASWQHVTDTLLSTTLSCGQGSVGTVEHLLSALRGMSVDNVLIEVHGEEIPAMDGSAKDFVTGIAQAGRTWGQKPKKMLKVLQAVEVSEGDCIAGLYPSAGMVYDCGIEFAQSHIGSQQVRFSLTAEGYAAQIAPARTFGFEAELEKLQASKRALGAGLHNAVGLGSEGEVLNPEGLRFADEFVRHKVLDAVGDLSLAGAPLLAEYRAFKPSHRLHHRLLQALFADEQQYLWVELPLS